MTQHVCLLACLITLSLHGSPTSALCGPNKYLHLFCECFQFGSNLKHIFPKHFFLLIFKLVYFKENLAHVFLIILDSFALNSSKCCFARVVGFPRRPLKFVFVCSAFPTSLSPFLFSFKGTLFLEAGIFAPSSR